MFGNKLHPDLGTLDILLQRDSGQLIEVPVSWEISRKWNNLAPTIMSDMSDVRVSQTYPWLGQFGHSLPHLGGGEVRV